MVLTNTPVNIFVAPSFSERPMVRILRTYGAGSSSTELLHKELPHDWSLDFSIVEDVAKADFILVPQDVKRLTPAWLNYLEEIHTFATAHNKPIIVQIGGDLSYRVHVEGVVAFKGSDFRFSKRPNEIIFPGYVEDLTAASASSLRHKGAVPVVGFCGYAGFPSLRTYFKYITKNSVLDLVTFVTRNSQWQVYKRGIYFRRKAMRILMRNSRVRTNFIVRQTFSGNKNLTDADPVRAREEYLNNIETSDFVLCPKGDGNYSARFYETLAMGRIPILIDTEMVLPLENTIDYSKFVLRVPHDQIASLGEFVADFYHSLSNEEFVAMQHAARNTFKTYLRYDKFFNFVLPRLKEKGVAIF